MTDNHLRLLIRIHDGDDRCGCLRLALAQALDGWPPEVIAVTVEECLRAHPAGSIYRGNR
jgi:hypothetical protein